MIIEVGVDRLNQVGNTAALMSHRLANYPSVYALHGMPAAGRRWSWADLRASSQRNRFFRLHDEVRNFLRPRSTRNESVSLAQRRILYTARTRVLLTALAAA